MGQALVALVTALVASAVLLGFYQWRSMPVLFALHAVGMILAWALMVVGTAVYKGAETRPQVRLLHGVLQTLAFVAFCVGYYGIFKNHELNGKRNFHIWPLNNAKTIHVFIGYLVFAGMLIQVCQGWAKKLKMDKGVFIKYLTHPKQGRYVQFLAASNILLAAYFMGLTTTMIAMSCTVVLAMAVYMLPVKKIPVLPVTDLKRNLLGETHSPPDAIVGA